MEIVALVVLVALGAVVAVGGLALARKRAEPEVVQPPPRAWKSDTVTPVMLGLRNRAPERVARNFVVTQGALLAMRMAEVDGAVTPSERDAIRGFILARVTAAHETLASHAVTEAENSLSDPVAIEAALDALRALGSEEQRQLVLDLLVHVAHSDGVVRPEEFAFMQRVGKALGLSETDVKARIELP